MNNNFFIKMIIIFSIPAIGMLFYSINYSLDKYSKLKNLEVINTKIAYIQKTEQLLNSIQKERGISATFITSKGKLFNNKLKEQKKISDEKIKTYIDFIINKEDKLSSISNPIKEVQANIFNLKQLRKDIINNNIDLKNEIKKYNQLANALILSIDNLLLKENKEDINKKLYSIMNIIIAKDYAGQERAILANSFYKKNILEFETQNNILKLIAYQENYLNKFKLSLGIVDFDFFNKTLNKTIIEDVENFRKDLFNYVKNKTPFYKPQYWWDISTNRINSLGLNIDYIMNKILKEAKEEKETLTYVFFYSLFYCFLVFISLIISFIMLRKLTKSEEINFLHLKKLKKIYNILSNTNELIIYNYKMNEVLKQACVLTSRELDLFSTFVCLLDKDSQLKIVESSHNTDVIDFKTNKKRGIYLKSIFEEQSIILDNIFEDKSSLDLEIEKQNKIKSMAIYPLYKQNKAVGILCFCSKKINYFDKEITSILKKMTDDLSFGLQKEEKELVRLQYEEELRIASYAFDSQEAMVITDIDANIIKVNNSFVKITGYEKREVIGKNPNILQSGKHDKNFYSKMWEELEKNGLWAGEIYNKRKNGEIYPENTTIMAIKDSKKRTTHYIAQFFDITDIKKTQSKLMYEAQHDSLTGLFNRTVLKERLNTSIISANRHNNFGALMFLDLDNFKYINDSLGHEIGNKLLKKVASILKDSSREDDLIVRLEGDEFVILVNNLSKNRQEAIFKIESFANKIKDTLNIPLEIDSYKLIITTSIGIALYPEFDKNPEEIIKNADSAMYLAKKQGKNKLMFYYDDLDSLSRNYLKIENDLRKALINNEFELYYQAKYNYQTNKIIAYEALIRWNHPTKGLLFPDEFIYVAEQSSLIINIGKWVLENCCLQINSWLNKDINLENIKFSINISSLELEQADFINNVKDILKKTKTNPKYLDFELVESSMLRNLDSAINKLSTLQDLGISTSLDDFGIGFSSLNYISKLPVNSIKLDKSFIMEKNLPVNEAIIEMLIQITNTLKKQLVIEGVETKDDINYLSEKGAYIYQGYYISKPIKENEAIKLLNKYKG